MASLLFFIASLLYSFTAFLFALSPFPLRLSRSSVFAPSPLLPFFIGFARMTVKALRAIIHD
jgi:hypothetical protein